MNSIDEKRLARLIKSRKPIIINNTLVKKILGFDDMRDFTDHLYHWGYNTDFTYQDYLTSDWQKHIRAFLRSYLED